MSVTTGIINAASNWTSRCDQLISFFTAIPGVSLYSDTGTGNSRILFFSFPGVGEYHLLKVYYSSVAYMYFMKIDKTATLVALQASMQALPDWTYMLIQNGNTVGIVLKESNYRAHILWSKCGDIIKFFAEGDFLHPTLDLYTSNLSGYHATISKNTISGKHVIFPAFVPGDSVTADIAEVPLENLFTFYNQPSISAWNFLTIDGCTYLLWDFGYSPTYHMVRCT